jgi:hypothetical protein
MWLLKYGTAYVIVARFGELCMAAVAARERAHHAPRGLGYQHERARPPAVGRAKSLSHDGEQHLAAGDERGGADREAVVEEMATLHDFLRKQAPCPAVMLAPC